MQSTTKTAPNKIETKKHEIKVYKNIPSTETGVQTLCYDGQYLITQCLEKNRFTLWKIRKEGYEKISTSNSPLDFDKIIPWKHKKI